MTFEEILEALARFAAALSHGPHGEAIKDAASDLHEALTGERPADPAQTDTPEPAADTPEA